MSHLKNQLEAVRKGLSALAPLHDDCLCQITKDAREALNRAAKELADRIEAIESAPIRQRDAEAYLYRWACGEISQSEAKRAVEACGYQLKMAQPGHSNVMIAKDTHTGQQVRLYI